MICGNIVNARELGEKEFDFAQGGSSITATLAVSLFGMCGADK
jgi:hypothetical protein